MRRKTLILSVGLFTLVTCGIVTAGFLVKHEPRFYRIKAVEAGELRTANSRAFVSTFSTLLSQIVGEREQWQATFTEAQLNSYFAEEFIESGAAAKMLPNGVSDLRVCMEGDRIRLGFQYGEDPWSTVISLDFRVWIIAKETNSVAIELLSLRAGAVPISAKSLMKQMGEFAERQNTERTTLDVTWYRHNGNPVALLRFMGSQARPTTHLQQLNIGQGVITVAGRSVPSPTQVQFNPAAIDPLRQARSDENSISKAAKVPGS